MSSSNALGWVFPGPGQDTPSTFTEVDFGPVHYKDSMIVEFTPASYTGDIRVYCDYQNTAQGNIWTLTNTGSPLTYTFNQTTPNAADPNDYHACHFFFAANTASTSSGNTLSFQYINNATKQATTWSKNGSNVTPTSTSTTSTSTTTSSTSTKTSNVLVTSTTPGSSAATGSSSSPDVSAVSQPSGLSGGAIAGIVIGILALIAIIAGLGFFFGRRARRNRSEGPGALPPRDETKIQPMYQQPGYSPHDQYGQYNGQYAPSSEHTPAWAGKHQPVRMGELHGQSVSELDAPAVHELGDGRRMELP